MKRVICILFAMLALAPLVAAGSGPSKLDQAAAAAQTLVDEAAGNGIRVSVGLADISGGDGGTRIVG